jgi:(p)ppGpp synthase/HD superfamily hydrolase
MRISDSPEILLADAFADEAHRGQLRAYTGEPYITHPRAVFRLLSAFTSDLALLAAALLHDCREMSPATDSDLVARFGARVALLVDEVTDKSTPEMGNRAIRKEFEVRRLAAISPDGKTLKLTDILENASTIADRSPKFARVWLPEKAVLMPHLVGGHPTLHSVASKVIHGALLRLAEASNDSSLRLVPRRRLAA